MVLNFNDYLFDYNDKVLEEVLYSISYSVFDNYDVDMVMFEVNNKEVEHISRYDIQWKYLLFEYFYCIIYLSVVVIVCVAQLDRAIAF